MNTDVSFALIGSGKIGTRHAGHIQRIGKLIAVCDTDPQKFVAFSSFPEVKFYTTHEELLAVERPDVVSVCTPNGFHAEHTIAALRAGCHVVCEKPMALSSADAKKMMQEAAIAGRYLFIVKQNRFNEAVVVVKDLLASNKLGKIYSFQINGFWNRNNAYYSHSWHGSKRLDGGTLFTQFSHFIDILYWLLGDVADAQSYLTNAAHASVIETEDTGVAVLQMECGAIGTLNYTVNSYAKNMEGSITLFGEKGTVKIGGEYLNTISYQHIEGFTLHDVAAAPANDYGYYKGSMSNHDKVYQNVIDVLYRGGVISANAADGAKTVEIIEKIYQANGLREND